MNTHNAQGGICQHSLCYVAYSARYREHVDISLINAKKQMSHCFVRVAYPTGTSLSSPSTHWVATLARPLRQVQFPLAARQGDLANCQKSGTPRAVIRRVSRWKIDIPRVVKHRLNCWRGGTPRAAIHAHCPRHHCPPLARHRSARTSGCLKTCTRIRHFSGI